MTNIWNLRIYQESYLNFLTRWRNDFLLAKFHCGKSFFHQHAEESIRKEHKLGVLGFTVSENGNHSLNLGALTDKGELWQIFDGSFCHGACFALIEIEPILYNNYSFRTITNSIWMIVNG